MLRDGRVFVNSAPERNAKREVADDDQVSVGTPASGRDPRVRVLFEDADLVVIDKAEGLLAVPADNRRDESAERLLSATRPVHHVHRLDRDTSGVLVFAKNAWIRERLQEQFATHDIERVYVTIVHGQLEPPAGTIRSFLAEDRELRVRTVVDPSAGKEAITHYRTVARGHRYSMVEVTLETGRRNQIRVHFAEAGHPVVGDAMYGHGADRELRRLALHARDLGFLHPRTRRRMRFTSEVPQPMRELRL